jgi:hypothetical protein
MFGPTSLTRETCSPRRERIARWRAGVAALAAACLAPVARAEIPGPAPELTYAIEVALDAELRHLSGVVELSFRAEAVEGLPDPTIDVVPLHLYWNGFADAASTYAREAARVGLDEAWAGRLELLSVVVRAGAADSRGRAVEATFAAPDDGNRADRSLAVVALPRPVRASEGFVLRIAFEGDLPPPISRAGVGDGWGVVAQWFPKVPVFDRRRGFLARQFHADTEFFADFASYDVRLRVPPGLHVVATGEERLADAPERRFVAERVHDFAWVFARVADSVLVEAPSTTRAGVVVRSLAPRGAERQAERARRTVDAALGFFSGAYYPYPYAALSVVVPPAWLGGTQGMEYPMLFMSVVADAMWNDAPWAGPVGVLRVPELVDIHEVGHQWFYGIVASDEGREAFLDEGLTTDAEIEGLRAIYGPEGALGVVCGHPVPVGAERTFALPRLAARLVEPIDRGTSWGYVPGTYGVQVYDRMAMLVESLRRRFGRPLVARFLRTYVERYAFRHPDAQDLVAVARDVGGDALADPLLEGLTRVAVPTYAVVAIDGRATDEASCATPEVRLVEPGGRDGARVVPPGITRFAGPPDDARDGGREGGAGRPCRTTEIRVESSGARAFPTEVRLVYEDGRTQRVPWAAETRWATIVVDGRQSVVEAVIDPDDVNALDLDRVDDGLRAEPEPMLAETLSRFAGAMLVTLASLVGFVP